MSLDRTTEAVSHFIGLFHLEIEEARLRVEYDTFRAARLQDEALALPPAEIAAPRMSYALKPFEPKLAYVPPPPGPARQPAHEGVEVGQFTLAEVASGGRMAGPEPLHLTFARAGSDTLLPVLPPPNSIAVAVHQGLYLSDDDLMIQSGTHRFAPLAADQARLEALVTTAQALTLDPGAHLTPLRVPGSDAAAQMAAAMRDATAQPGATLHRADMQTGEAQTGDIQTQAALPGPVLNGEAMPDAEMPEFSKLLPVHLRAPDDDDAAGMSLTGMPDDGTTGSAPSPFAVDPGHAVVAGGNIAVNEVLIGMHWVDAPVIAVGGNVTWLTSISQVNVLHDRDSGIAATDAAPSVAINAAHVSQTAAANAGPQTSGGDLPAHSVVTRIEGDLFIVNWVQQFIFASDMDRAEIVISGTATYIGLGDNLLSNVTQITELGFHYDLIQIGGDMLTLNAISQINVLLDDDTVTGHLPAGAQLSTGDNLQLNTATVATVGVDTATAMPAHVKAAMQKMAAGDAAVDPAVATDPMFAGTDVLKVLQVTGNLTKANIVTQHNVLGDADQVHLALDDFIMAAGSPVTVTTGSNAQLNAATILDFGLDSIVMAGGEVYSDALIHQANLIDADSTPGGVALAPLANEAVAFLAEGMIAAQPHADMQPMPTMPEMAGAADPMQTVLA